MFLLVETTLKVRLHRLRLSDLSHVVASGYCFVRTWSPSSTNSEEQFVLHVFVWICQKNWTSISSLYMFPSWCSSSRQRTGWIIFWRLVPGKREMTGPVTSPPRSTSCGRLKVGRWKNSKTPPNPSYTTSTWGKSYKQNFTHTDFVHMLMMFSQPHPADVLLLSLFVYDCYLFVCFFLSLF